MSEPKVYRVVVGKLPAKKKERVNKVTGEKTVELDIKPEIVEFEEGSTFGMPKPAIRGSFHGDTRSIRVKIDAGQAFMNKVEDGERVLIKYPRVTELEVPVWAWSTVKRPGERTGGEWVSLAEFNRIAPPERVAPHVDMRTSLKEQILKERKERALASAGADRFTPIRDRVSGMKALTLKPQFAHAVAWLGKRKEMREWDVPEDMIGERIAIHAGSKLDPELPDDLGDGRNIATKAFVATATLDDQWNLLNVVPLDPPIPAPPGQPKFWPIPIVVESKVRAAEARGRGVDSGFDRREVTEHETYDQRVAAWRAQMAEKHGPHWHRDPELLASKPKRVSRREAARLAAEQEAEVRAEAHAEKRARVLAKVREMEYVPEFPRDYRVGEQVRILGGKYASMSGSIVDVSDLAAGWVTVEVSFFGRTAQTVLDITQIQKVAKPNRGRKASRWVR